MLNRNENIQGALAAQSWETQPWQRHELTLLKLQERVFKHAKDRDLAAMHRGQHRVLASWSARLLAVRLVAEVNDGKLTAGIDGVASLTPAECYRMAERLDIRRRPRPTRRVEIPKPNGGGTRPLSVPTIKDRAVQTLVRFALEPQLEAWATVLDPNSYGFRPGRGVADAISACRKIIDKLPKHVVSADIEACFDRIDHDQLLRKVQTYPAMLRYLRKVLSAGAVCDGALLPTTKGTPQGGPLSGVLLNFALLGLESTMKAGTPGTFVVRYADDLRLFHPDLDGAIAAQAALERFLAPLGLNLNPTKTRIRHTLTDHGDGVGFDFLGFTVRQHERDLHGQHPRRGYATIITPSPSGLARHYRQLAQVVDQCRASSQDDLIQRLNPVINGWAYAKRSENSKAAFRKLDHMLFKKLWSWARRRHGNKGKRWIVETYFNGGRPWLFTSGQPGAPVLSKHADVEIVPRVKVRATSSPFDGDREYWQARQSRVLPRGGTEDTKGLFHPLHRKYRKAARVAREVALSLRVHRRGRMLPA